MAAIDQTYRKQRVLDVVFAVSCLALLGSVLGMWVRDYNRDWKRAQRLFRDVESVRNERALLEAVPEDVEDFHRLEDDVRLAREVVQKVRAAPGARDAQPSEVVVVDATAELTETDENGKVTKSEKKTYPARIVDNRVV